MVRTVVGGLRGILIVAVAAASIVGCGRGSAARPVEEPPPTTLAPSTTTSGAATTSGAVTTTVAGTSGTDAAANELPGFEFGPSVGAGWSIDDIGQAGDPQRISPVTPERGGWKATAYERLQPPDVPMSVLLISQEEPLRLDGEGQRVDVGGTPGRLGEVYAGDGDSAPVLTWSPRPGLHLVVMDVGGGGVDLRALAGDVRELSADAWAKRIRGVQYRWRDARNDPASGRVEVLSGEADGARWVLTAVVPPGYPLDRWDRRQTCADLSVDGVAVQDRCDGSWSLPLLGAHRFAVGTVAPGAGTVTVRSVELDGTAHPAVDATAVLSEPRSDVPVRFYVAVVAAGHCYYQVTGARSWSPSQVIRPLGRLGVEDHCALGPTPPTPTTAR